MSCGSLGSADQTGVDADGDGGVGVAQPGILPPDTLEQGLEADSLTDARRACPAGAGQQLVPVCGGGSGYEQAKAKLRCIESDEVAVAFGPPA